MKNRRIPCYTAIRESGACVIISDSDRSVLTKEDERELATVKLSKHKR